VAARIVGPQGKVFALDILPMDPIADVDFIQGDFREDEVLAQLVDLLDGRAGPCNFRHGPNMSE
jgi:23S rRNA (uridine2552-2'-O)-methyltransferase